VRNRAFLQVMQIGVSFFTWVFLCVGITNQEIIEMAVGAVLVQMKVNTVRSK